MKTLLVFAGTTEGRKLAEALDRSNISCHVSVATQYGSHILKTSDNITVHSGRLDLNEMEKLMDDISCDIVVDATHPYATKVTDQIKALTERKGITYLRLQRENDSAISEDEAIFYESVEACAEALLKVEGPILLTTGSKQLKEFTKFEELRDRITARVIPGIESINLCYEAGLEGKQIIAMQGPFSREMNESIIKEYGIKHLVTKESGTVGGVDSKIAASQKLGIRLHVIKRPLEESEVSNTEGLSMKETIKELEKLLGLSFAKGKMDIVLAGIGPGNTSMMTEEVRQAISKANVIFGAKRMIDSVESKAEKYPFYLKEDIIPILKKLQAQRLTDTRAVILFSGDTGFFSGCRKMYDALIEESDWKVKIMPGISSISILASRFGIDWHDGKIISLHGTDKEEWSLKIKDSIKHNKKTFFITSGLEDIKLLGKLLEEENSKAVIKLGYQLSYNEEKLFSLSPGECKDLEKEGLYTGVILSGDLSKRLLVPDLDDDFFIRDKVPMTKEEIRKLSICQMKLKEGEIVYDIGAGSGSIAVQAAAMSPSVKVYALECNHEAVELIKNNVNKAKLFNVHVIEAMAPNGMKKLPPADVAFIGGSKGNLYGILTELYRINPKMRVVMNAVSMETICEMNHILTKLSLENLSIKQVSVSNVKKLGDYHMLNANNPVFIFSFDFAKEAE